MSAQKHTFIVFAPDYDTPGTYEKRLSLIAQHVARADAGIADGWLKMGGPMLSPESIIPGGARKHVGSTLIVELESLGQVDKLIKEDIFYTSGVWDPDKLVILPYVVALGTTKIV